MWQPFRKPVFNRASRESQMLGDFSLGQKRNEQILGPFVIGGRLARATRRCFRFHIYERMRKFSRTSTVVDRGRVFVSTTSADSADVRVRARKFFAEEASSVRHLPKIIRSEKG